LAETLTNYAPKPLPFGAAVFFGEAGNRNPGKAARRTPGCPAKMQRTSTSAGLEVKISVELVVIDADQATATGAAGI
jgi:hypothetical protein